MGIWVVRAGLRVRVVRDMGVEVGMGMKLGMVVVWRL